MKNEGSACDNRYALKWTFKMLTVVKKTNVF